MGYKLVILFIAIVSVLATISLTTEAFAHVDDFHDEEWANEAFTNFRGSAPMVAAPIHNPVVTGYNRILDGYATPCVYVPDPLTTTDGVLSWLGVILYDAGADPTHRGVQRENFGTAYHPLRDIIQLSLKIYPLGPHFFEWGAQSDKGTIENGPWDWDSSTTITVTDSKPPYFVEIPPDLVVQAQSNDGWSGDLGVATFEDECSREEYPAYHDSPSQPLPIGTTEITWTAEDGSGNTASHTQTVTVQDTTPPNLENLPGDFTVISPDTSGVEVNYAMPTATDLVDESVDVVCALESGAVFPVGVNEVVCTATDDFGNSASDSFFVTVITASSVVDGINDYINSEGLPTNVKNALLGPLKNVPKILEDANLKNDISACGKLQGFIAIIDQKEASGHLDSTDANYLRNEAQKIFDALSCN